MARRRIEIVSSDFTGKEITKPEEVAEVRVLRHPAISHPVRLDAYVLEVAGLQDAQRETASIELVLPGQSPRRLTLDLDVFNKLFTSDAEDVLASAAPYGAIEQPFPKRRGRPAGSSSKAVAAAPDMSKEHRLAVREWANSNGYTVGDRGRIKAEILEAFEAAHANS